MNSPFSAGEENFGFDDDPYESFDDYGVDEGEEYFDDPGSAESLHSRRRHAARARAARARAMAARAGYGHRYPQITRQPRPYFPVASRQPASTTQVREGFGALAPIFKRPRPLFKV